MIATVYPLTVADAESAVLAAVRQWLIAEDSDSREDLDAALKTIEIAVNDLRLADQTEAAEIAAAPPIDVDDVPPFLRARAKAARS